MLQNYLKITLRILQKQPLVTLINIGGLSIGLAACLVSIVFIRNEITYDKFHKDVDDIYRITATYKSFDLSSTPYLLNEVLISQFDVVYNQLRISDTKSTIKISGEYYNESLLFTDPNYFEFFDVNLQYGEPTSVLRDLRNVVISDKMAKKYFAKLNPLGETIMIELDGEFRAFNISGVAEKFPSNSSLEFDFIIPLENKYLGNKSNNKSNNKNQWMSFNVTSFIKTSDVNVINKNITDFIKQHLSEAVKADGNKIENFGFVFNAFADHHLSDQPSGSGLKAGVESVQYLYIFSGISLLILLIAGFNFVNLSLVKASARVKEAALRKVTGATRAQLRQQFLIESIIGATVSLIISFGLAELVMLNYHDIFSSSLSLTSVIATAWFWMIILVFAIIVGVTTGIFPAWILSNLRIVEALNNKFKSGGNNVITKAMILSQFVIASLLVTSSYVMNKQQNFLHSKDLGFDQEQVIVIPTQVSYKKKEEAFSILNHFKNKLSNHQGFKKISGASTSFTRGSSVYLRNNDQGEDIYVFEYQVDESYLETLGIELSQGRNFSTNFPADKEHAIIVNEAFVKAFNLESPVGFELEKPIEGIDKPKIIGVTEDYYFSSLKYGLNPVILYTHPNRAPGFILVKVDEGPVGDYIHILEQAWNDLNLSKPFEFHFLDEDIQNQYDNEEKWRRAVNHATVVAIFLSCLGLLGMVSYTTHKRRKEIGIRKVLGASIPGLLVQLSKSYLLMIFFAFINAIPINSYLLNNWLKDFENRILIEPWIYTYSFVMIFMIALLTIGFQSVKAAIANPVDSLKEE